MLRVSVLGCQLGSSVLHTFFSLCLTGSSAFSAPARDLRCRRVLLRDLMMSFIIHRTGLHRYLVWHEFRLQAAFQAEFSPYCARYIFVHYLFIYLHLSVCLYTQDFDCISLHWYENLVHFCIRRLNLSVCEGTHYNVWLTSLFLLLIPSGCPAENCSLATWPISQLTA